uniref:Aldehyde dehydrogenase n=1 Tax=Gallus gallus TaxID=9031 RepID=A0A8V0ZJB6_CHICK
MSDHVGLVSCLWAAWPSGRTRPLEYHTAQLEDILEATALDMHKPSFEVKLSEISICRRELNHMLNNLGAWMKDENEDKNWAMQLDSAFICKDPYGVVLIIGPWNYPIYLLLVPLIGGGDGNCVVLKPSEISRNMERLVAEALLSYLNKVGKLEEITRLLENKFDYIFTGSPSVGRIAMTAAAKHLTPVMLELGGKNPCYISDTCDVQNVALWVVWGHFINTGQTCIAPDYVLCSVEMQEKLMPALHEATTEFYGSELHNSPDFACTVRDKQFKCVQALLSSGRVAIRGEADEKECYIRESTASMGPYSGDLWPCVVHLDGDQHSMSSPPARRWAATSTSQRPQGQCGVTAGCSQLTFPDPRWGTTKGNDVITHMMLTSLPFGGSVPRSGHSDTGLYHGRFTFETFSHLRSALLRADGREALNSLRYPPYAPHRHEEPPPPARRSESRLSKRSLPPLSPPGQSPRRPAAL